jgi:hypothetical protein
VGFYQNEEMLLTVSATSSEVVVSAIQERLGN